MANMRVDVNYTIKDGSEIVFRSPVDCSQITGLIVYYPGEGASTTSKEFALADAHGNNVGDIDHLFAENVVVKVILDVTSGMAFVQNADTNAYIESTFVKTVNGIAPDENGNVEVEVSTGGGSSTKKYIGRFVRFVGMSLWAYDGKTLPSGAIGGGVTGRGYQTLLKEYFTFGSGTVDYCYTGVSLGAQSATDASSIMVSKTADWGVAAGAIWTLDTITNDFKRNIPIGTIDDYANATGALTYYGALRAFKDKVEELSGSAVIVVCANALRRDNASYTSTSENTQGHTLLDYEYALMNVAARNGWYFVDQYRLSGITDETIHLTTVDGLHLNNFGYSLAVKPWIEQFEIIANKYASEGSGDTGGDSGGDSGTDEPVELVDTTAQIEQTDVAMNRLAQAKAFTGKAITIAYPVTATSNYLLKGVILHSADETLATNTNFKTCLIDADGNVTHYSAASEASVTAINSTGTEGQIGWISGTGGTPATVKFSVVSEYLDKCYMYFAENGDIIFAGKDTMYYGMKNIDGTLVTE